MGKGMEKNEYSDIDKRVSIYIEGKHGKIGVIQPNQKPTAAEWNDLHRTVAEIIIKTEKKKESALIDTKLKEA